MLPMTSETIRSSSAPGTPYFALAGMIRPEAAQVLDLGLGQGLHIHFGSRIEQGCEALLDAVGDIKRQRLDRGGRVHARLR